MTKERAGLQELTNDEVLSLVEMLKLNADLREDVPINEIEQLEILETEVRADIIAGELAGELVQKLPADGLSVEWMQTFAKWVERQSEGGKF